MTLNGEEDEECRDILQELLSGDLDHDAAAFDPSNHPDLEWGVKAVKADLTTRNGYQWPTPGEWTEECPEDKIREDHTGPCPRVAGDGVCIAHTWRGMASGDIPARTILAVGYREEDLLGGDKDKVRVRHAYVGALLSAERLITEANLKRADLRGADLRGADLRGANLRGADLKRANLYGADLRGANLYGADLKRANLRGANLRGANLRGANLYGANLRGADLKRANLRGANLRGANLYGADLKRANLYGADLKRANLRGAHDNNWTKWPSNFDPEDDGDG